MNTLDTSVQIPVAGVTLPADLTVPDGAHGVVVFAHGSGSGRGSPRNRYVATELNHAGLATVLVDLLTPDEERVDLLTGTYRFDIGRLGRRVTALAGWLPGHEPVAGLPIGLFGASTGAAAALVAAAQRPDTVRAVVSRGGRPDLAGDHLRAVRSPALLIVGERDELVIELNRAAMGLLTAETRLEIVPGAAHLFEEPGALERVAELAVDWFNHRLRPRT